MSPTPNFDDGRPVEDKRNQHGFTTDLMRADNNRGNIHQHTDNSKRRNDLLPWFVIIALVASFGAGGVVTAAIKDSNSHAEVLALRAELVTVRSDFDAKLRDQEAKFRDKISPLQQSNDLFIYYLMENDAKLIAHKVIKAEDSWAAQQIQRAKVKSNQQKESKL